MPKSESRQRTVLVGVRLTLAEYALVKAAQAQINARGAGTVLREAFMAHWRIEAVPEDVDVTQTLASVLEAAQGRPGGSGS